MNKRLAQRVLVLSSSEFEQFFEEGPGELAYAGTPFSGLTQHEQGRMCQEWGRKVLQEQNPEVEIVDPELEQCCNGVKRGRNQASYDFLLGGRRVEIKSARIAWESISKGGRWHVEFGNIKLACIERTEPAFDDLYLVIVSPTGLHVIKHDLVTGVRARGKLTAVHGYVIKVSGSRSTDCWEDALDEILEKLCQGGGCRVVAEKPLGDLDSEELLSRRASRSQAAVDGLFMSSMSREKRGKRIQEIGLAIDRRLNPGSNFSFMQGNAGRGNAPNDWVRGTERVELKSCSVTFDRSNNRWKCSFHCIKPDLFDELWLAVYTSVGIFYYLYRSGFPSGHRFCSAGAATKIQGRTLYFLGPSGVLDPLEAFKTIEEKMISKGCELVAIVEWEKGGSMMRRASSDLLVPEC